MFKALIVEDDPLFRQILKEILASRFPSISIKEAAHGVEALRELEMNHLDLVFMDIKLPGMNGLELTKRIKESHPGILPLNVALIILFPKPRQSNRKLKWQCNQHRPVARLNPSVA
jgi:CheY-like chemotaxis protein